MIVHLDADAFFASVEQAADPKLRGRAIAVGGERRGIIASASYEARKMGVYTPMPTARARRICPRLVVIPGDFEKYEQFSRFMFSYAYDFTPEVEVASIDEGYFDLGGMRAGGQSPREVAETIRRAIAQSLKISVSEGIGANKLVSQVASKLRKPACFLEVPAGGECPFLWPLENKWLPGVGQKLEGVLNAAGLTHIRQIAHTAADLLGLLAGGYAPQLRAFANGIDNRPVVPEPPEAKSYGEQETFEQDVTDEAFLIARLRSMADRLMAKVREDGKSIRTVTVRVRYNDMDEMTRGASVTEPTDLENDIYHLLPALLKKAWERRVSIRLVGLKLSHVYGGIFRSELPLMEMDIRRANQRRLADVIDQLRGEGRDIMRGHDYWLKRQNGKPRGEMERGSRVGHAAPGGQRSRSSRSIYAALNIKSYYSFMDSLLPVPAIIGAALEFGIRAVAITDLNLHGAVEFFQAAKAAGIKPVIGAEICSGGARRNLYVENKTGYANLCRILSLPEITARALAEHGEGLISADPDDPRVALPEIRYRAPGDLRKFNILRSIRTLTRLHEKHPQKRAGDFHFPAPSEVAGRWSQEAVARTLAIADRCEFEFELDRLRFPNFRPPDGSTPHDFLRRLAFDGLRRRYGALAGRHERQLREELAIIGELGYEEYFLVVRDLLDACERRGIRWITRGSAADSLVCYCLGISNVCPIRFELYFRRFLNRDRMALNKLPDIDIDFAHDRKDDVVDLIFERYGPEHAAIVGGFNTFQGRSAVADIAKVLGVSEFQIRRMTGRIPRSAAVDVREAVAESRECGDFPWDEEPYRTALEMAGFLDGFPRHAKMHPCGVVLSREPITSLTPVFTSAKGYATTHFDMDAVEAVGLVKMDILAQGGLAVIRDTLRLLEERGIHPDLDRLEPWEDAGIWEMIASGNARGVHHIESPAMISLSRMCNTRDIDLLVAVVSVIRPGAANGAKKTQFARRAQGMEPVEYAHPSLEPALHSTFGVVAYEEQILQICEAFAGLDPGRADVLRRALSKQKKAVIEEIRGEFFKAAQEKMGRTPEETGRVWELVEAFQGYAFCRAHSTAYAVEAYQGVWLKRYHPAEFLAGVLGNGKGFYSTLAYTLECRRLGIGFLAPDVNDSAETFSVVDGGDEGPASQRPATAAATAATGAAGRAIRVPLRQVGGLGGATLRRIGEERGKRPFESLADFYRRVSPLPEETRNLIRVGAFDGFGGKRTAQFWQLHHLAQWPGTQGYLFSPQDRMRLPPVPLTEPDTGQRLRDEMELLGFTVSGHPLDQFAGVAWDTYCPILDLNRYQGQSVTVCGLIIEDRLHGQVTGELMKFITICDYGAIIECEMFAEIYRRFGLATARHPVVEVTGRVEPFDNGLGCTLRVEEVRGPRTRREEPAAA